MHFKCICGLAVGWGELGQNVTKALRTLRLKQNLLIPIKKECNSYKNGLVKSSRLQIISGVGVGWGHSILFNDWYALPIR